MGLLLVLIQLWPIWVGYFVAGGVGAMLGVVAVAVYQRKNR